MYTAQNTHAVLFALLQYKWRDLQTVASDPQYPIHSCDAETYEECVNVKKKGVNMSLCLII
jgi:hypothetical protein